MNAEFPFLLGRARGAILAAILAVALVGVATAPRAEVALTAFRLAVAEASAPHEAMAAFYRERDFDGIWTGPEAAERRNALMAIMAEAGAHGLPQDAYDPAAIMALLRAADTALAQGQAEVALTRLFLEFAHDVSSGILDPGAVDHEIERVVVRPDPAALLAGLLASTEPRGFLHDLAPQSPEYARLMAAKMRLESVIAQGGWGPTVAAGRLEPGDSGAQVVALRDRLVALGYLQPGVTQSYDAAITTAVRAAQAGFGLNVDGVAGGATIDALNVSPQLRLQSVIVAMERERWLGDDRGDRHIWVNLTDFTAAIVDQDRVTFRTRSVIGAVREGRVTPEFSDVMEYMVINPSWYVPRSIIVNEYLPALQRNSSAAGHLRITDSAGRLINRGSVNFGAYTARNFPFAMHQPPSASNALGFVKFMFPNPYDIYLHDTPARDLFAHEVRAFSHGCIRLQDPRDFAYTLLARQTDDPEGFFAERLNTGAETRVNLEVPVPVHIDYRTAFTDVTGALQFRADIYGRDAMIWDALSAAGVTGPQFSG